MNPTDLIQDNNNTTTNNNTSIKSNINIIIPPKKNSTNSVLLKLKIRINPGDYNIIVSIFSNASVYDLKKEITDQALKVTVTI
jgi:hypothetical protein